jgi:hypothetical protein
LSVSVTLRRRSCCSTFVTSPFLTLARNVEYATDWSLGDDIRNV